MIRRLVIRLLDGKPCEGCEGYVPGRHFTASAASVPGFPVNAG